MAQFYWFNLFVFLHVLLLILLAMNVSRVRIKERVPNGDGGKVVVKKAIRTHANGVENVLIFGLIVLALELSAAPAAFLATLVVGFTLARIVHAVGMLASHFNARRIGAGATYLFALVGIFAVLKYGVLGG